MLGTAKALDSSHLKLQYCWALLDLSSFKPTLTYVKLGIKLKSYFISREIQSETQLKQTNWGTLFPQKCLWKSALWIWDGAQIDR